MKWKYKTYNNRTPESCPRVFFCCNKTDFNKYFDEIAGDILKYQPNAAIFYYEHEEEPEQDENYLFDLSGMQLFVVPVTTDFFLEEGFARQLELPFAMEHHIPVLPLIQENGLESLVNESFGNIQCINKSALLGDVTAVPYAQKMKQFLNEVLIGDELDKRIRAEFSIPGENFNNTIRDKITKSNLFTMVVTPNLLEKPNYVMEMEYPMAQELRLEILPVEALTTNELAAELCEKIKSERFDGIKDYFFSMLDEREHYIVGGSEYELTIENALFKS